MTLTIDLPDEETAALAVRAKAKGLSTEQYIRQVIENDLAPEWLRDAWKSAQNSGTNELSMEEIDAEISSARTARRKRTESPGA